MKQIRPLLAAASLLALSAVSSAQVGARLYVTSTADVIATYLGNSASYSNDLYLDSPTSTYNSTIIFNNHASPVGSTVNLGSFAVGTELIFRLHVNDTGYDYFTGDAARNPDGQFHALVDPNFSPTATAVYFEDLYNGPFAYNDLGFSFTNVRAAVAPGPMAALPFALMALRRRKKA